MRNQMSHHSFTRTTMIINENQSSKYQQRFLYCSLFYNNYAPMLVLLITTWHFVKYNGNTGKNHTSLLGVSKFSIFQFGIRLLGHNSIKFFHLNFFSSSLTAMLSFASWLVNINRLLVFISRQPSFIFSTSSLKKIVVFYNESLTLL